MNHSKDQHKQSNNYHYNLKDNNANGKNIKSTLHNNLDVKSIRIVNEKIKENYRKDALIMLEMKIMMPQHPVANLKIKNS